MKVGTFIQYKKNLWIIDDEKCMVKLTGTKRGVILSDDDVVDLEDREQLKRTKVEIAEVK